MNKCPKCGRYMSSYMEYIFGGATLVWTCECGYSTKDCTTGMSMDNKTNMTKSSCSNRSVIHSGFSW